MFGIDGFADLQDFGVRQVLNAAGVVDAELVGNFDGLGATDTMDIRKRDDNALVGGDIYPGNTSHLNLHAPQRHMRHGPHLNADTRKP